MTIIYFLFILDCCCKHSLCTAAAEVEKKQEELLFLTSPIFIMLKCRCASVCYALGGGGVGEGCLF